MNEPEVPEGCAFFLEAFRDLSTCRPVDGPIPWTAAALYADKKGLETDVGDLLWDVVRKMDTEERRWVVENTMTTNRGSKDKKDA